MKSQATRTCSYILVAAALALGTHAPMAHSQEICSTEEVQTALSQLSCVADGVYLSPEEIAARIDERCGDAVTEEGCRRCFRKGLKKTGKAFKELIRSGLVTRGGFDALRSAVGAAAEETCSALAEPTPEPEDPSLPDGSNADENRGLLPNPNSDDDGHRRRRGGF